jgi:ABC-type transport system involved in multi-copper enzyme maturation permease subunit
MRFGTGPVFSYERIASSRRWQVYAARSFMVASLLAAMAVVAGTNGPLSAGAAAREYAKLGEAYFFGLIGVELAIVMLAAPAATAGAICLDRSRGTLDHMLVTDLSDTEIVLGKLAARLMPVLGLVACSWPVMGISSLLGGIDPVALTLAFAIILAVAVLGCTMALALSVWARQTHEVVMAVYTCLAILLVAYPTWLGIARSGAISGPPRWLLLANPFYLAFTPYIAPDSTDWWNLARFFTGTLGFSVVLAGLAVWRMRPASVRVRGRTGKTPRLGLIGRLVRRMPAPSLDRNPILWREWHRSRPSTWMTILVGLTIGTTTVACIIGAVALWREGVEPGRGSAAVYVGIWSYLLQVAFGLLMFSALAPMSLSEERQRGSLDVLMTTPLSTRTIVMGKWLGTFRLVPWLSIGPGLVALALATARHPGPSWQGQALLGLTERLFGVALFVATIFVHGAAITSIGLILATWLRRQSRAIAVSVTLFVLVSIGWPILVFTTSGRLLGPNAPGTALSPIMVTANFADGLGMRMQGFGDFMVATTIWDVLMAVTALALLEITVRTFDGRLGRVSERSQPIPEDAVKSKPPVYDAIYVDE